MPAPFPVVPLVGSGTGVVDPCGDAGIHDEQRLGRLSHLHDVSLVRAGPGSDARLPPVTT